MEVFGLDAGSAGDGSGFVACGRAGAGGPWSDLAGVAVLFPSGGGPGAGGRWYAAGGPLRPLPGRGVFRSKKSHSGRQYLCCDWLCGHGRPFFWTFSTVEERVVASQDRTLVEEDRGFLDPFSVYYEYHGSLVRGARSVDASACKRTNDERRLRNERWMDESGQPAAGAVRLVSAPVGAAETEPKSWGGGGPVVLGRRSVLCSGVVFSAALWRQLCSGWGLVRSHGYQRRGGLALWFSAGNFLRDTACGPVCRPLEEAERNLTKCSGYLKKFMLP